MWKCQFSIRCWDSNPQPRLITTRPGLPPKNWGLFISRFRGCNLPFTENLSILNFTSSCYSDNQNLFKRHLFKKNVFSIWPHLAAYISVFQHKIHIIYFSILFHKVPPIREDGNIMLNNLFSIIASASFCWVLMIYSGRKSFWPHWDANSWPRAWHTNVQKSSEKTNGLCRRPIFKLYVPKSRAN